MNTIIPPEMQSRTLEEAILRIKKIASAGKRGVIFVDLDLTALLPTDRILATLRLVGERFVISDFLTPENLIDRSGNHLLPGYTEEAWTDFIEGITFPQRYPSIDWTAPEPGNPAGRRGGDLYAAFRSLYWKQDLRTDQVSPGLKEFGDAVAASEGELHFVSGRSGSLDDTLFSLAQGGIENPILHFGQRASGLPVPRAHVRDRDGDTKHCCTKAAVARGEVVVAVIDDRASNREAVCAAASSAVLSVAVAAPGFSCAPDARDLANPYRISTFQMI